jgi:hypothetical protein
VKQGDLNLILALFPAVVLANQEVLVSLETALAVHALLDFINRLLTHLLVCHVLLAFLQLEMVLLNAGHV